MKFPYDCNIRRSFFCFENPGECHIDLIDMCNIIFSSEFWLSRISFYESTATRNRTLSLSADTHSLEKTLDEFSFQDMIRISVTCITKRQFLFSTAIFFDIPQFNPFRKQGFCWVYAGDEYIFMPRLQ